MYLTFVHMYTCTVKLHLESWKLMFLFLRKFLLIADREKALSSTKPELSKDINLFFNSCLQFLSSVSHSDIIQLKITQNKNIINNATSISCVWTFHGNERQITISLYIQSMLMNCTPQFQIYARVKFGVGQVNLL